MGLKKETLKFDGDASSLTSELDEIAAKFLELAEAENAVFTATSKLGKNGFTRLVGTMRTTTDANEVLLQKFSLTKKQMGEIINEGKSLKSVLAGTGKTYILNTKAAQAFAESQAKAARETAAETKELLRLQDIQGKLLNQKFSRGSRVPGSKIASATQEEGLDVSSAEDALERLAASSKITGKQLDAIFATASSGSIIDYGVAINRVRNAVFKLLNTEQKLGDTAEKEAKKAKDAADKKTAALKKETAAQAKLFNEVKRQFDVQVKLRAINRSRASARGPGAPQGSQKEQLDVSAAKDNLQKLVRQVKVTETQLEKVFKDLSTGAIVDYGEEINRVRNSAIKLLNAEKRLGSEAERAHNKAAKAAKKQTKELSLAQRAARGLVKNIGALARVGAVSLFVGTLFRLQQAFEDGVLLAGELTKSIAEVETIQGTAARGTAVWAAELRGLSDAFGIDILDQAEAAYQTLSNQVAKGADVTEFLTVANKLAAAGVTDVSNSVNLLTSVLNAYNKDVSEASDISGKLFKTVELGRVRVEEMAESFGKILVPAQAIGIRFEELSAAVATTTIRGIKFNEASTLIRGVIQKLIKPTEKMSDFLAELGFNSGEAAIQTLGLGKFLALLDERTRGSSSELGQLFNRIRAVTGGLIFAGKGLDDFNKNLAQIDAAGVADLDKAAKTVLDTLGKRFDKALQEIKNFFLVDLGPPTLKVLLDIFDGMKAVAKGLSDLKPAANDASLAFALLKASIAAVGIALTLAVLPALQVAIFELGIWAFVTVPAAISRNIALALSFGAAVAPLAILTAGLIAAKIVWDLTSSVIENTKQEVRDFTASIADNASKLNKARKALQKFNAAAVSSGLAERNKANLKAVAEENKILFAANKGRIKAIEGVRKATTRTQKNSIDGLKKIASTGLATFNTLTGAAEKTAGDVRKAFLAATKGLFQFDLSIAADKTQVSLIENQILNLQAAQEAAAQSGDKANFDRATAQIKLLAKQRFAVTKRLSKAQQGADRDVFKARAEAIRAEASGDKDRVQRSKDALKDAKKAQGLVGVQRADELNITNEIAEVRRKLSRAAFRSPEADALKQELNGLRNLQVSLNANVKQEGEFRDNIVKNFEKEKKLRLDLQDQLAKKAREAFKEQLKARILAQELTDLEKDRRDFNLAKTLKSNDPKEVEDALKKQESVAKRILEIQKSIGVQVKDRASLEQEVGIIREALLAKVALLENKTFVEKTNSDKKAFDEELKAAIKLNNSQTKLDQTRLDLLRSGLAGIGSRIAGLGEGDASILLGVEEDTAGAAVVANLIKSFKSLELAIKQEEIDPGSVKNFDVLAEAAFEAIVKQQLRGAQAGGQSRLDDDPVLKGLTSNLAALGDAFGDRLFFLTKTLEEVERQIGRGAPGLDAEAARLQKAIKEQGVLREKGLATSQKSLQDALQARAVRNKQLTDLKAEFNKEIKAVRDRNKELAEQARRQGNSTDAFAKLEGTLDRFRKRVNDLDFTRTLRKADAEFKSGKDLGGKVSKRVAELTLDGVPIEKAMTQALKEANIAVKDQVKKNHQDAAKAMKPILVDAATASATEGVKATDAANKRLIEAKKKADAESATAQAAIDKQKAQQEKIRKASEGLTGFARQVALQDLKTPTSGVGQRKAAADSRAEQRKRNEDFLRERRERKAQEAGSPLGAIPDGGGIPDLVNQLKAQQAIAKSQALGGDKDALGTLNNLDKQIKILSELQQRGKGPAEEISEAAPALGTEGLDLTLVENVLSMKDLIVALDKNSTILGTLGGPTITPLPNVGGQELPNLIPQLQSRPVAPIRDFDPNGALGQGTTVFNQTNNFNGITDTNEIVNKVGLASKRGKRTGNKNFISPK